MKIELGNSVSIGNIPVELTVVGFSQTITGDGFNLDNGDYVKCTYFADGVFKSVIFPKASLSVN